MTDLTPNDLSHLSDEEFHALCPQGEHAPGAEPLSPAAQAVLDAVCDNTEPDCDTQHLIAAALRAVADQVVPLHICGTNSTRAQTRLGMRQKFLAIAAELEGQ